jgi:aerobic carbon-monoxide dehydrogenase medium subunit
LTDGPDWLVPDTLEQALEHKAQLGDEATVLAGGTFLGILINQGFLRPSALLNLGAIERLDTIVRERDVLRLGPMARHRAVETSPVVNQHLPSLARAFGVVASPRVRNQATVGGVLADADYASDPPAMLIALGARVTLRSVRGARVVDLSDLIVGHYQTCIEPDELLTEVRVPLAAGPATYRKFRSRSSEDRPCVTVAAVRRDDRLRVVVGAVAEKPQEFPDACAGTPSEIGAAYAERISPISDTRGSAAYRKRVIAVEVRRAVESL